MSLQAPVNVSPLIKFTRWTLLLAGVAYGATRYSALKRIEDKKRAEWEAGRPAREAKAAAEKARKSEEELRALAKEAGEILPPDWKP